jgi:predicted DNA-binding transcriptional regulator AlpA
MDKAVAPSPSPEAELVDAAAVASLLSISNASFFRLAARGGVPSPIRLGRLVRYRRGEIDRWILLGCPSRIEWEQRAKFDNRLKTLASKK